MRRQDGAGRRLFTSSPPQAATRSYPCLPWRTPGLGLWLDSLEATASEASTVQRQARNRAAARLSASGCNNSNPFFLLWFARGSSVVIMAGKSFLEMFRRRRAIISRFVLNPALTFATMR